MLITRGLIPLLAEGSARATDSDTTDEILASSIDYAKEVSLVSKYKTAAIVLPDTVRR